MQLPKLGREIGAGGEGKVLEHLGDPGLVVKVYHSIRPKAYEKHLKSLSNLPDSFIKPLEVYSDSKGVQGFSMRYVNLNDYFLINNLFNKGFCTSNSITPQFKEKLLELMRKEIEGAHSLGVVIGDLNQYNVFFSLKGELVFVDTDSYKTQFQQHSGVLLDDIRDWTTPNIDEKTDAWSYDILYFWITTYCHPFKWVVPGNTESLEHRIKDGKSFLSSVKGMKIPPLYVPPVDPVLGQFQEIFKGRRYMVSADISYQQAPTVVKQQVKSSDLTIRELYTDVTQVYATFNQISIKTGNEWKLVVTDTPKVTREIVASQRTIFPSDSVGIYATYDKQVLYTGQGKTVQTFIQPSLYFADGSLLVVDYKQDMQWVYKLNAQLGGTIQHSMTPVFAKSMTFRGIPIQNFGKMRMANIPVGDYANLINVLEDAKDGHYTRNTLAVETKKARTTEYSLSCNGRFITSLNYLPHFGANGIGIFLPGDGYIEVISETTGMILAHFDVSFCTESSKLFTTASGILLLENNILYLLNTK